MKVTKGRWDDNTRIYNVNPVGDWTEAIQARMYRSLDTFKWEAPEIGSISFRGLTTEQADAVSRGFERARQLAVEMYAEGQNEDRLR